MTDIQTPADSPPQFGKLSPNELAILNVLWKAPEATGKEVLAALPRPLAQTTLLTYLARLEVKGYVKRRPSERGYLYSPAVPQESVAGRLLDQLLTTFEGRFSSLVSHFVRTRKLSDDERQRLRQVLDQLDEEA
jgi:predicted transcriptional regulator